MLQGILDFFQMIVDTFTAVIDFIVSFFSDLVYLVTSLADTAVKFPTYISWLPSVLITALVTAVALLIILRVAGRD